MRGHETPENHPLTTPEGFSTVSEVLFGNKKGRTIIGPAFALSALDK